MNAKENKFSLAFFKNGERMMDTKLKTFVPVTGEIPPEGNKRVVSWLKFEGLYPTCTLTYNTAQVTAKFNAMPPEE